MVIASLTDDREVIPALIQQLASDYFAIYILLLNTVLF